MMTSSTSKTFSASSIRALRLGESLSVILGGVVFLLGLQAKPLDFLFLCFVVAFFLIYFLVGVWYPTPWWNEEGVIGVQRPGVKTVPLLVLGGGSVQRGLGRSQK